MTTSTSRRGRHAGSYRLKFSMRSKGRHAMWALAATVALAGNVLAGTLH